MRYTIIGIKSLIFRWLLLFCADFLVSDCQHGIGCDGVFFYCWMSCLDFKNIDQLLPLHLLCFLCFVVCGIFRWPYTTRIPLDFPLIWLSFFVFCSLPLLLYNLHFSRLDNPLYSPLLGQPKIIKMMSQTSIQHSLLPHVNKFSMMSSRDLWRHFPLNCFSKRVWLSNYSFLT